MTFPQPTAYATLRLQAPKARPWKAALPPEASGQKLVGCVAVGSQIKQPVIATDIQLKIKQRYRREAIFNFVIPVKPNQESSF